MSIVISEFMDNGAVDWLRARHAVAYDPALVDDPQLLHAALPGARALIVRNRTQVSRQLLEAAPDLRVVGRLGVGLDNIDTDACRERGITVIPAVGANARAVAEYVIGAILLLSRGVFGHTEAVLAGCWPRPELSTGQEVGGKRLGLLGFGNIGQEVARLARALGIDVVAHDPGIADDDPRWVDHGVPAVTLDTLLATADFLSLHLPLTESTHGLLDRNRLLAMKRGAILINTARGGVVDEAGVVDALHTRHLRGAALDVFSSEPLPALSVLSTIDTPNLLLTPHVAGLSAQSNHRVSYLIATRVSHQLQASRVFKEDT